MPCSYQRDPSNWHMARTGLGTQEKAFPKWVHPVWFCTDTDTEVVLGVEAHRPHFIRVKTRALACCSSGRIRVSSTTTQTQIVCPLAERLQSVQEALGSALAQHKPNVVAHSCKTSTREVEAGEPDVQGCTRVCMTCLCRKGQRQRQKGP